MLEIVIQENVAEEQNEQDECPKCGAQLEAVTVSEDDFAVMCPACNVEFPTTMSIRQYAKKIVEWYDIQGEGASRLKMSLQADLIRAIEEGMEAMRNQAILTVHGCLYIEGAMAGIEDMPFPNMPEPFHA